MDFDNENLLSKDMGADYQKVLDSIKESKLFEAHDQDRTEAEISAEESINVAKLFGKGIITTENILSELGLVIFHEFGHYGIVDVRKWMVGKIKYGI
jgi:hypothetical protein